MVKLFGILENVFYISLGITFALILLLVYHFKQRLSAAEKKSETMYEIITNIVQELNVMKSQLHVLKNQPASAPPEPPVHIQVKSPVQPHPVQAVIFSDSEEEEEEDSEEDADADSEYSEEEYDSQCEEDDVSIIKYELIEVRDPDEEVQLEEPTHEVQLEEPTHLEDVQLTHTEVHLDLEETTHTEVHLDLEETTHTEVHLDLEDTTHTEVHLDLETTHTEVHLDLEDTAHIDVHLDLDTTHTEVQDDLRDVSSQDYKKMNLNQLRSLASARFPEMDTGKMKKAEIIKVLSEQ